MDKERQHFYRQMLAIAIPVSLQSLLTSFLNTLDTIMISSLGDASIASVGLANQVFFLFIQDLQYSSLNIGEYEIQRKFKQLIK